MARAADIGSKRLISLDPQGWGQWMAEDPTVQVVEMLTSDFQWVGREGDVLMRVRDLQQGDYLIANEIQLRYSPRMPRRMRAYAALAEEKFQLPVFPVLVIILPAPRTSSILPAVQSGHRFLCVHC